MFLFLDMYKMFFYHGLEENNKFCFIKSEALPSQRSVKQKLYKVWIALNKREGWMLTANGTCMAG